ncbi:MAG: hypothetical protein WCA27_14925 [Candidatus Sulfotelmatobacter sp.]
MSTLSTHEKLIRKLTRDHNATIKRLEAARDVCSIGTNSYRQYEQTIAEERRKHTAQLVEFGIIPQDLQKATKTEYLYISHCHTVPANREEMEKLLSEQAIKACKGLHYSDADEEIRRKLEQDFK